MSQALAGCGIIDSPVLRDEGVESDRRPEHHRRTNHTSDQPSCGLNRFSCNSRQLRIVHKTLAPTNPAAPAMRSMSSAGVEVASNPSHDCAKPRYRVRRRSEAEKRYGITGPSAERVQSSGKSERYIQSAVARHMVPPSSAKMVSRPLD